MKSEQLKQFERYAEAVGAERYWVTSIKMREDGGKQTFILDKKDGITRGFTPQEIEQRTPERVPSRLGFPAVGWAPLERPVRTAVEVLERSQRAFMPEIRRSGRWLSAPWCSSTSGRPACRAAT